MRINKLRLKNLNSLKGIHEIDFTSTPLDEAGIFAITGPTGAGKSTLLDAICLALYNQIPRSGKVTKTSIGDDGSIITRNTSDSFSEVEYEINDKIYRSYWSIKINRNGNLNDYEMELSNPSTGYIFDLKKSQVPEENTKIIGLDFQQFLKSSLLAQGDFAQFLKANKNERGELLEKITGTTVYRDLSKLCFEKEREENKKVEAIRLKIGSVTTLNDDDKKKLIEENENLLSSKKQLNDTLEQINTKIRVFDDVENTKQKIHQLELQKTKIIEQQQSFEDKNQRLKVHELLIPHQDKIITFRNIQSDLMDYKSQEQKIETEKDSLHLLTNTLKTDYNQATLETDQKETELSTLRKVSKKVHELDLRISSKDEQLQKLEKTIEAKSFSLETSHADLVSIDTKIVEYTNQITRLTQDLKTNEILKDLKEELSSIELLYEQAILSQQDFKAFITNSTFNNLKTYEQIQETDSKTAVILPILEKLEKALPRSISTQDIEALEAQLKNLQDESYNRIELHRLGKHIIKLKNDRINTKSKLEKHKTEELDLNRVIDNQTKKLEIETLELDELEIRFKRIQLEAKYDQDRELLQEDQPCFLCGSTEHPYVQHYERESLTEQKIKEQRAKIKSTEDKLNQSNIYLSQSKNEAANLDKLFLQIEHELSEYFDQFEKLKPKSNLSPEEVIHEDFITTVKTKLSEVEELIKEERKLKRQQEDRKTLQSLIEHATKTQEKSNAYKNKVQPYAQYVSNLNLDELKKASQNFSTQLDQKTSLEKEVELLEQKAKDLRLKIEDISKEVHELKKGVSFLKEEINTLTIERRSIFGDKNPDEEIIQTEALLRKLSTETRDIQLSLSQNKTRIEALEKESLSIKTKTGNKSSALESLNIELATLCQTLDIDSVENLSKGLLSPTELTDIKKELTEIQDMKSRISESEKIYRLDLKKYSSQLPEAENTDDLISTKHSTTAIIEKHTRRSSEIELLLQQDQEIKSQQEELFIQLAKLEKEHLRWKELADLIGSADGKKFSVFAQELTLQHLIHIANKHLSQLSDRYKLYKDLNDQSKDNLYILDQWQGDNKRAASTLSGGESFIVSLALALGLSEMASKNIKIGSLFIDEGFGTLDQSTLDTVLDVLEQLQYTSNCKIGIISHVEMLKERISCQIQLTRGANGFSSIAVS